MATTNEGTERKVGAASITSVTFRAPADRKEIAPLVQQLHQLAQDKKLLFQASINLEVFLRNECIQALQDLNTALSLPDATIRLSECLREWREEVDDLFPISFMRRNRRNTRTKVSSKERQGHGILRTTPKAAVRLLSGNVQTIDKTNWKTFSGTCQDLTDGLRKFSAAIEHLTDFRDMNHCRMAIGKLMITVTEMYATLKEEAGEEDENDFDARKDPELRLFVRSRLDVCRAQLDDLSKAMEEFIRLGPPIVVAQSCVKDISRVRDSQKRVLAGLANVTQVSTFFAAVVASTLQFSVNEPKTPASVTINTLWLTSLVLAFGSVFNSLLAMTMRKVVSSTPLNAQPWYITFWIRQSYAALLVIAVIMYVFGLGVYVVKTQSAVVATTTCVAGGLCAAGILIVFWKYLKERFALFWKSRRNKKLIDSKKVDDAVLLQQLDEILVDDIGGAFWDKALQDYLPTGSDDDVDSFSNEKVVPDENNIEQAPQDEHYDPCLSRAYVEELRHVGPQANSGLFSDFKRGRIQYMRCSPCGRWVAVCYELACLVYDVKNGFKYHNLTQDDDEHPVEHAEWSPNSSFLLTRASKELKLWKVPGPDKSAADSTEEFTFVRKKFGLPSGPYTYIKWVDQDDFVLLIDGRDICIVNSGKGMMYGTRLALPEDFKVTQVFPMTTGLDWIVCLAKRSVEVEDTRIEITGEGVDYLLVLQKGQTLFGKFLRRMTGGKMRIQQSDYVLTQRKLLPRNARNVKLCRSNRYILINYDVNENGMVAPELWMINDKDKDKDECIDLDVSEVQGTLRKLSLPSDANESIDWGEASFAGPTHDLVLCEVGGSLRFYHFDRSRDVLYLRLKHSMPLDFGGFDKPIFTWGETTTHPVMFVSNTDGYGSLCIWTVDQAVFDSAGVSAIQTKQPDGISENSVTMMVSPHSETVHAEER